MTLLGCSKSAPKEEPPAPPEKPQDGEASKSKFVQLVPGSVEASKEEKYQAALLDALNLLAERKYPQALARLEEARSFQETDLVKDEIDKLKLRIDQQKAAEATVADLQMVLEAGRFEEAAKLATDALARFGDLDVADTLMKLKRQADALVAVKLDDKEAKFKRFRTEGEQALSGKNEKGEPVAKNLRAAVLAYEQALAARDDAELRKEFEALQGQLKTYDDNRHKAAELRRDPVNLEDALAALQEAKKAWDTLQIQQEIEEYKLALEQRRDRVSVAEFEVRGDVAIPAAGKTVADEILPHLKSRFDLVERGQVDKVLGELKLEAADLGGEKGPGEVGKLAKIRYLVLGSVTPLGGITVSARLVDVKTGLVVQTAKVAAPTPDDLMKLLPDLAKMLLLSDEQKLAFEAEVAKKAAIEVAPPVDKVPEAPAVPDPDNPADPPPPIVVDAAKPPEVGDIKADDFKKLVMPPVGDVPVVPMIVPENPVVQKRMLAISIQLGDNLFRRGRFLEAHRHFQLALLLAPGQADLLIRIDRCRPFLPPVVIVDAFPPPRPRIAVLPFVEIHRLPTTMPFGVGSWTAANLAPYFGSTYEIVDQGEVYWYMGRLGLSLRDVLYDPWARRWLGRALNVRYFVLGRIEEVASFDVTTYLVDSETGFLYGTSTPIRMYNTRELRWRLGELARLTMMNPLDRDVYLNQGWQTKLNLARIEFNRGNFVLAFKLYGEIEDQVPGNVEFAIQLNLARRHHRHRKDWEEARRLEWQRLRDASLALRTQQDVLVQQAQLLALQKATLDAAILQQQQLAAQQQLAFQAQLAFNQNNFQAAVQIYESALALKDDIILRQKLEIARLKAALREKDRAAKEREEREERLRNQRKTELKLANVQLEAERKERRKVEEATRKAQQARDDALFDKLLVQAKKHQDEKKYDAAIAALQTAQRLRNTPTVEERLNKALVDQALAKDKGEGMALQARLKLEAINRLKAEKEAKENKARYDGLLEGGRTALKQKQYEQAVDKFEQAKKVYATPEVLTGLRQAQEQVVLAAKNKKETAEKAQLAQKVKDTVEAGKQALKNKKHDDAIKAFTSAKNLTADPLERAKVEDLLSKAATERDQLAAKERQKQLEAQRQAKFGEYLKKGEDNLKAKKYAEARDALKLALAINPKDSTAQAALDQAQQGLATSGVDPRLETVTKLVDQGHKHLAAKRFDEARQSANAALKVMPEVKSAKDLLREVDQAFVTDRVNTTLAALKNKNLAAAEKSLAEAKKIAPSDPAVLKASQEVDQFRKGDVAEKTKLAAYNEAIKSGTTALKGNRFDEARKAFRKASDLMPADKAARDWLLQVDQAQVKQLLDSGRVALSARKLTEASKAFGEAQKLAPKDPGVIKALGDLEVARAAEKAKVTAYQDAIKSGQDALKARRFDDAIKSFQKAEGLLPGDATAANLRKGAEKAKTDYTEYSRLVNQGNADLKAKRYKDAEKNFSDALKYQPGDGVATKGLQQARDGQRPPPPPNNQAAYDKQMRLGADYQKGKKYAEAVKAYEEALRLIPKDAKATSALRDAKYLYNMTEGQRSYNVGRYNDAVRFFDAALQLFPSSKDAKDWHKKAKDKAK
jgi:tetratricopeptide (TPR) repeat protein